MVTVRQASRSDEQVWLGMRIALWPDGSRAEHAEEVRQFFAGEFARWPWQVLLAIDDAGGAIGFAEVSIRPYAEGCASSNVGYLEGWFVAPSARGGGVGAELVAAAEQWARQQGCSEFASDAAPDNEASVAAHRRLGFEDVGLVRCFRKEL